MPMETAAAVTAEASVAAGASSAASGTAEAAGQAAANAGLVNKLTQEVSTQGISGTFEDLAKNAISAGPGQAPWETPAKPWGKSEPIGTTSATVEGGSDSGVNGVESTTTNPKAEASKTAEPTTPTDTKPAAAEQKDTTGLKPGDRSYDAIIAEGDAKRAFEAAKADPATSPEDLARLEKEYADATGEREQAVADRDSATIDARTEQVREELQGQLDQLSASNAELKQTMEAMGKHFDEAMETMKKGFKEEIENLVKYVKEKDPEKKKSLEKLILELAVLIALGSSTEIAGEVKEGVQQRR